MAVSNISMPKVFPIASCLSRRCYKTSRSIWSRLLSYYCSSTGIRTVLRFCARSLKVESVSCSSLALLNMRPIHVCSVMSYFLWPYRLSLTRLLCLLDFPGKNTGMGCHFLLQGIFLTQGSNSCLLCLLHWEDSLPLSNLGSMYTTVFQNPLFCGLIYLVWDIQAGELDLLLGEDLYICDYPPI